MLYYWRKLRSLLFLFLFLIEKLDLSQYIYISKQPHGYQKTNIHMASHDWVKVKPLSFIYIRSKKESYVSFYLNSQTLSLSLCTQSPISLLSPAISQVSLIHTHHQFIIIIIELLIVNTLEIKVLGKWSSILI